MNKRITAIFTALCLTVTPSFTCLAEENSRFITGTQIKAEENVVDVDEDIKESIEELIPDTAEEIHITSVEDLLILAHDCSLDTWSVNKKVVLDQDLDLSGSDFDGIPSFGGTFDGKGHTVSGVKISRGLAYSGLFVHIQKTGAVKDLHVTGEVYPPGSTTIIGGIAGDNCGLIRGCSFEGVVKGNDYIGGIAGINELSGSIERCTADGFVSGKHFVGGITGKNDGNIADCINNASVNTTNIDNDITIDSLEKLNTILNLIKDGLDQKKDEAKNDVTNSDAGGIAGLSIGIITHSVNNGSIGYDHVGYNVGGIAGRQSGYIFGCTNNGKIKGRKDVGGIVGQAEPYVAVDLSLDTAYQLEQAVSKLHDSVTVTLQNSKDRSTVIKDRLEIISKYAASAVDDAKYIAEGTVDLVNGISVSADKSLSKADYLFSQFALDGGIVDRFGNGMARISSSADSLKSAISSVDMDAYIQSDDERKQYDDSKLILESAASQYSELTERSKRTYYNLAIRDNRASYGSAADLQYIRTDGSEEPDYSAWSASDIGTGMNADAEGEWKHSDGRIFPDSNNNDDVSLEKSVLEYTALNSMQYAFDNYTNPITGEIGHYEDDIASSTSTILGIYEKHVSEIGSDIKSDSIDAFDHIKKAADDFYSASQQAKDAFGAPSSTESVTFPKISDEYKTHVVSLADNMQGMNDNFNLLGTETNNATGDLMDDLQVINDQFADLLTLYTDAIDGVLEKDYTEIFTDESYEAAEYTKDATVDSCINKGECYGDIDTSGIAGTMAIEYDFDMEGDFTGGRQNPLSTAYLTKCVLRGNKNYGEITSLKNYSGGVCGLQEMGTIIDCGSYSKITSSSGDYVGGVAGASLSHIVRSYARGELDGEEYVGGIAGDGKHIKECLAIVTTGDAANWYGAVAGHIADDGQVRDNYFVSDTLAGIDRVSYSLKAEPVDYAAVKENRVFKTGKDLSASEEAEADTETDESEDSEEASSREVSYRKLPSEFGSFKVNFVLKDDESNDGDVKVGELSKEYGQSVGSSEYPEIEYKEGFYVLWDRTDMDSIVNDITVTAEYRRYRTTLSADEGTAGVYQSELLVDGQFKEDDRFVVERMSEDPDDENGRTSILKIRIPDDGSDEHVIRFRPRVEAQGLGKLLPKLSEVTYDLYLVEGSDRTRLKKSGTMGGYATYIVKGNELTISPVVKNRYNMKYILIAVAAILLIILAAAVVLIIRHGGKMSAFLKGITGKVSEKIEDKEQIFYDDSQEDLLRKEIEEYKRSLKEENAADADNASEKEETTDEEKPLTKKKPRTKRNKTSEEEK